jgi:two-component system LytT family response regulator
VAERVIAALADLGRTVPSRYSRRLAIKQDGRVILVDARDVVRIEAAGNYVEIHAAGKAHLMRETLAHIEARLDPARFVRVSRSSIVSVDRVRELRPMFNGDFVLLLQDGSEVSGSRRFRHRLEPLLNS